MKTKILSLAALFIMGTFTVFAANKTEKIKVHGNCGMCEKRIKKAGHDTPHFKATNEVYKELPGCCHYDRKKDEEK